MAGGEAPSVSRDTEFGYLLNDQVENRSVTDFACWVADYVFQQQILCFGSTIEKEEETPTEHPVGSVMHLFSILPSQFTSHQLEELRSQNGQGTNVRMIISRWKKNNMIQEVAPHTYATLVRGAMEDFYHPMSA